MTGAAYLRWMEYRIRMEGRLLNHKQWPCRKKRWKVRNNFNDGLLWNRGDYQREVDEFFAIEDMINDDNAEKLFLLYIQMEDPNNGNKDAASAAWTPLAKVIFI